MSQNALAALLITIGLLAYTVLERTPAAVRVASPSKPAVEIDPSVIVGPPKVKLAVLVVFDQMRFDYVSPRKPGDAPEYKDWTKHFPPGGFQRMMTDGAWFSECYYPYATTTTGPGHAAIMTGTTQNFTGIINNEWYDRTLGKQVYCATAPRYENIGNTRGPRRYRGPDVTGTVTDGGSPDRLIAPSLGDNVKAANRGSKVVGLSMKDRSAIFPSGHHADMAFWFSKGEFITSSYYTDLLPRWVRSFNDSHVADRWYNTDWTHYLLSDKDYEKIAGPDNAPGEADRYKLGKTFPHRINGGVPQWTAKTTGEEKSKYYEALITTPFGNDLLLEFAKRCIEEEKLGQRETCDLLTVSFSCNDYVGHAYGPDSQEVMDVTLRSDRIMKDLMNYLDAKIGKDEYVIVLTADHGICPLPEVAKKRWGHKDAQYLSGDPLTNGVEKHLDGLFGNAFGPKSTMKPEEGKGRFNRWVEYSTMPWVYLNYRQMEARNLSRDMVTDEAAKWLRTQKQCYRVYTAKQLQNEPAKDAIDRLAKASYHPENSGDLLVVPREYCIFGSVSQGGTTHGSPFDYDRHVPLLVYGPGLEKGVSRENVHPQHAAIILAHYLGLKPPRDALYDLPKAINK